MEKKRLIAFIFCVAAVLWFVGCKAGTEESAQSETNRVIKDDLGNEVSLPLKVTRAVSLAPNLTEIVFAVGAGDRLVGVTTFCNYPEQTKEVRRIGDTMKPNIETIVALRPQVVLVTTASQLESFHKLLQNQGIQVFVTNPATLDGVYGGIAKVGEIFGETGRADELVKNMKTRIAKLADRGVSDGNKAFVQIDKSLFTIGKGSFISDAIKNLGIESVTDDIENPYPKISKERARSLKPDLIIVTTSPDNDAPNPVFDESPAVRNERVFLIDADILSRPGPRIVDALENIADQDRRWLAGRKSERSED